MSCDNVITVQDLETDKKHSTFYREVITGKAGGTGADIDSATNAVTGQTQATLPKVLSNVGFSPAGFDFATGGTLTERDKAIFYQADGNWYSWGGAFPKVIPPASSPASTGGIADNAWNVSTSAFMYRDWEGFTAELLAQGGVPDNGQPDELGNSQRVDAIKVIATDVASTTNQQASTVISSDGRTVQDRLDDLPSEVDAAGTAASLIAVHDLSLDAHPELRQFISSEADRAEIAADVATINAQIYPNIAAGLAAVIDGKYFSVPSPENGEYLILYVRTNATTATEVKRYPSSSGVDSAAERATLPFVYSSSLPLPYRGILDIELHGNLNSVNRYGVAVLKRTDVLFDVAIYSYATNGTVPLVNVARLTLNNYVPTNAREWLTLPYKSGAEAIYARMLIDWGKIPVGTDLTSQPISAIEIASDRWIKAPTNPLIWFSGQSSVIGASVTGTTLTLGRTFLKLPEHDKFIQLSIEAGNSGDASHSFDFSTLPAGSALYLKRRDLLVVNSGTKVTARVHNASIDGAWYSKLGADDILLASIMRPTIKRSWTGLLFDYVKDVGWREQTFSADAIALSDYIIFNSNSTGNGAVTIKDNILSINSVLLTQKGTKRFKYLSLENGVAGTVTSRLNLASLPNITCLYIEKADFEGGSNGGTITVRTNQSGTSWFNEAKTDHYILAVIQTANSKNTWSGPLLNLVSTTGWNDPEYTQQPPSLAVGYASEYNVSAMGNYRYKTSIIENGGNASIVIGLHGDSLTHMTSTFSRYATHLARHLRDKYGNGGGGWYDFAASVSNNYMYSIDELDANDSRSGAIEYIDQGAAARGVNCAHAIMSSGATITLNITTPHTKLVIHYQGGQGSFTYSLDGGASVAVPASEQVGYKTIEIIVPDAVHNIAFTATSDNTIIFGVDMQRDSGIRVHKFGNRGLKASDVIGMSDGVWGDAIAAFNLDSFTCLLGTNEKSSSVTPSVFKTNMTSILTKVKERHPNIDFAFIAAPNTQQSGLAYQAIDYAAKLFEIAVSEDVAFISTIPLFGTKEKIVSTGTFYDNVHPTVTGGKMIARRLAETIFS